MFGKEPRYKANEEDMKLVLHRFTGVILFQDPITKLIGKGTGILISQNLVLTVSHNIFNLKMGHEYVKILFFPGACGRLRKAYEIEQNFVPEEYKKQRRNNSVVNDYGLLKLKERIFGTDFIKLNEDISLVQKNTKIAIFGYPSSTYQQLSAENGNSFSVCQEGLIRDNAIVDILPDKFEVLHLMSTEGGMSGSAILAQCGDQWVVIGVHKGGKTLPY